MHESLGADLEVDWNRRFLPGDAFDGFGGHRSQAEKRQTQAD
jgi:hypothetical protein